MKDKKLFALKQIAPYYIDPTLCAYEKGACKYLTSDNKMCVLGKNLLNPLKYEEDAISRGEPWNAEDLIDNFGQEILIPESRDILSSEEWQGLQQVHDMIAKEGDIDLAISTLDLFTLNELQDYIKNN